MAIRSIHPGPFSRIGDRYAHFIDPDHFLGRNASAESWLAPTNSSKNGKGYEIEVMLPGYTRDEINIIIDDDTLEITAEKKEEESKEYITRQIPTGFTSRKFQLPKNVDRENINANLENGILKIKLSESKEKKGTKKIDIQ